METTAQVAHPTLYGPLLSGELSIFGQRCGACGKVSFPRQPYGCETCGSAGQTLVAEDLRPDGELVSFALIHRHFGKDILAPFVMAEVRLDSGPMLRCALDVRSDKGLKVGARVRGVLMMSDGPAATAPELRFQPQAGQ